MELNEKQREKTGLRAAVVESPVTFVRWKPERRFKLFDHSFEIISRLAARHFFVFILTVLVIGVPLAGPISMGFISFCFYLLDVRRIIFFRGPYGVLVNLRISSPPGLCGRQGCF